MPPATALLTGQADRGTSAVDPSNSGEFQVAAQSVDDLVRAHIPLVGHIVREVCARVPSHVNRDDLISAGMYALTVSAQSFRAELGVPFARFASIRIRGGITDELRSMDWASRGARSRARELDVARTTLTQSLGREPSRVELAQAAGLSPDEIATVEHDADRAGVLSLQDMTADAGAEVLAARDDGPETLLLRREQVGYVRDAVAELPERLRVVITGYFFEGARMADIAKELGVTESRVSQMRGEGLKALRAVLQLVDEPAPAPTAARSKAAAAEAYRAAVAARSTLAGRLAATTVLCEPHPVQRTAQAG
ncbi:sigma-70 family RNA polymerase sigma factor [uncultured Jatrophihabitans sp.]|uniref:sigma-70 family RNA polymerase sigma factor n=1 Tax=uncultured Jatrophihabitans sp. TaxID=1610747 RepID=UPI0035CAD838